MRMTLGAVLAAAVLATSGPAMARDRDREYRYYNDGRGYDSYAECRRDKRRAKKRGTVIGAAGAGVGAAVLGADVGGSLLAAGVGAVAGNVIGKNSKKC